jgi:3-phosphoshikimate 1-carboxyvinyltransferase
MIVTVHPSAISGTIQAPTSKSSMQRACAAALLADKETIISNPGASNDDLAAKDVIKNLGATITEQPNGDLLITPGNSEESSISPSGGQGVSGSMNCGEAGLGIRMFAPIAALNKNEITINGTGSLLTRPMNFFDEIFPQLGIKIQSNGGKLPIKIQGPLQPKNITIDGSLSSQFLTGLLFAYGKSATVPVTITVNNLKSKPYIDLTLQVMKHFGYDVVNNNYESFLINPKKTNNATINYTVEGDWSGAAFLLVMGAVAGEITKAKLSIEEKQIIVGPGKLQAFHFDATECPDLFPPLVALASYCEGTTVIEGVKRLEHKESNRGLTLQEEFGKMGVTIKLQDDLMLIEGGQGVKGATVHSHHDHRIAMACAVAGLKATGDTIIEEAEAINKSYPDFYEHLKLLKASVSVPTKQLN